VIERGECRLCDGAVYWPVLELPPTPVANAFASVPDSNAKRYPLQLAQCLDCGHVQLRHIVEAGFGSDYKYRTPAAYEPHLRQHAHQLRSRYPWANRVMEIGSNNGRFIRILSELGFTAVGVDQSGEGPDTILEPFTRRLASSLPEQDLIVSHNVFAHIDDLQDVFAGMVSILSPRGAIVFEVQYLPDLINRGAFDMIYHEHLDYHTLKPLARFARRFDLVLSQWEHVDTHGGSIRVTMTREGDRAAIPDEHLAFDRLQERISALRTKMHRDLPYCLPLAAFGATAKATTLIHTLGLAPYIEFCVDDTPQKQGKYIPGTDIEILPRYRLSPNYNVLLTAWNYADEIARQIPNRLINPFEH